jgi:peptide/nickel transport system permease protein
MGRFVIGRIIQGLIVVFGVVTVVFVVTRVIGDPAKVQLPVTATDADRELYRHLLGLDRPIWVQYFSYLRHVATGDFGQSSRMRQPALGMVFKFLPATLELVSTAIFMAAVLSLVIGVIAALKPGRAWDRVLTAGSMIGLSMPQFWIGLLMILIFGVKLHWFPVSGRGGLEFLVMPSITLALPSIGRLAMIVRSCMIDELNQPYVMTAQANGLYVRRIVGLHALRNAISPAVTLLGWELIRMLAGFDVVVEVVFGYTGIGHIAYDAIKGQDFTLLQTIVLVVAVMVVIINIGTDLLYRAIDPRVRVR